MKKFFVWFLVVLMTTIFISYKPPVLAQKSEYAWVLINVVDYDNEEKWAIANEHEAYNTDFSCSEGVFSAKTTFIGKAEDWRNPPKIHGEAVRVTAAFDKPPERLYADKEVSISLNVSASENTLSFFTFGGSASADFDKPDIAPGSTSRSAIRFTNSDGEINFEVGAKNNYGTVKETLTATLPAGREEGEQIALRQQFYMGVSMGSYYIYEWRGVDYQPVEKPEQKTYPKSNTDSSFAGDPDMKRSGVHISDLYGEVLVELYDDDGFFVDSYTPNLGEELAVNAVIITGRDSGVILSLRDMTTYVLKSNSEVKIGDQSETESRIERLVGHVWCNVKQMLKDGSMDIEMSQGVCGIKGTTFILEDDGETSTVKVFEGEVEFTPLGGGNSVLIRGGNMLSAAQAETGTVQAFDMDTELADWSESVQEMTRQNINEAGNKIDSTSNRETTVEAAQENKDSFLSGMIVPVLIIVLLLVGGVLVFIVIRSRKKESSATNAMYGNNNSGQPAPWQSGMNQPIEAHAPEKGTRFCHNCGKPVSVSSKFCTSCGKSTN